MDEQPNRYSVTLTYRKALVYKKDECVASPVSDILIKELKEGIFGYTLTIAKHLFSLSFVFKMKTKSI